MKGTGERCPNPAEAFAIPTSTSTPCFFLWGILIPTSVPLFGLVVRLPQIARLDRSILDALITTRTLALTQVMLVMTNVFAPMVAVSRTIVSGDVIRMFSGSWHEGPITPVAVVCFSTITALIKELTENIRSAFLERLTVESPYSFLSGHAVVVAAARATGVLLILHHLANRTPSDEGGSFPQLPAWIIKGLVIVGVITLIVSIVFTCLYLGAHWFSDVVAGALVGTTSSPIITRLLLGSI